MLLLAQCCAAEIAIHHYKTYRAYSCCLLVPNNIHSSNLNYKMCSLREYTTVDCSGVIINTTLLYCSDL